MTGVASTALTDADLAAMEARAAAATPGPWADLRAMYREAMERHQNETGRWYHGTKAASTPVTLLAHAACYRSGWDRDAGMEGHPLTAACFPAHMDYEDLKTVIGLRWSSLRRTSTSEGYFHDEDADFIAHARADVPALLAEVRRLRALLAAQGRGDR